MAAAAAAMAAIRANQQQAWEAELRRLEEEAELWEQRGRFDLAEKVRKIIERKRLEH